MLIQWNDSFNVHIEDVDYQHQTLVSLINDLGEAMSDGKGKEFLQKILAELIRYTKDHFQAEERIFRIVDYPESEEHKREHDTFVQKVTDFQVDFDRGRLGLTVEVLNFLCDWVRNHIKQSDKKYAQYIDASGLRP